MTYTIDCPCGESLKGDRQRKHQVIRCSRCSRPVFIFPASPYGSSTGRKSSSRHGKRRLSWKAWRTPLIAGGISVVLLAVGIVFLVSYLAQPIFKPNKDSSIAIDVKEIDSRITAGRQALLQGRAFKARTELNEAIRLRDQNRGALSQKTSRELNQLHRQADLVVRLSTLSIEEIVRQGMLVRDPEEWNERFKDHRGKMIIFDDVLRRDLEDRPLLDNYVFQVDQEKIRLALEEVKLLSELPLEGQRWIFGVRLARVQREEGGAWVIRFEPESGVLITEPGVLELLVPSALEEDTKSILQRQSRWLEERTIVEPAAP